MFASIKIRCAEHTDIYRETPYLWMNVHLNLCTITMLMSVSNRKVFKSEGFQIWTSKCCSLSRSVVDCFFNKFNDCMQPPNHSNHCKFGRIQLEAGTTNQRQATVTTWFLIRGTSNHCTYQCTLEKYGQGCGISFAPNFSLHPFCPFGFRRPNHICSISYIAGQGVHNDYAIYVLPVLDMSGLSF